MKAVASYAAITINTPQSGGFSFASYQTEA